MSLIERINETLEHFDYVIVSGNGYDSDNKIVTKLSATKDRIFRHLLIAYGVNRVSKVRGGVKVGHNG
jgi:hypothetical protein